MQEPTTPSEPPTAFGALMALAPALLATTIAVFAARAAIRRSARRDVLAK